MLKEWEEQMLALAKEFNRVEQTHAEDIEELQGQVIALSGLVRHLVDSTLKLQNLTDDERATFRENRQIVPSALRMILTERQIRGYRRALHAILFVPKP